ncbi:MAG: MBL fold metallo-hydrolase [Verrucomicrobia bacterium CG_4_9_14_3_um_filter_43_20]|nr:MAG: hypothetical protein AUJ82_08120 [Verrucomicrobia bacterium CG1_02_43_26]PIP59963.1 MAG: MBL fold metallo-hydrolase [Verrucomicrobia bacterium CG22_combo_CG10-13_8_21_14_all_43_17]PIY61874.1 MAG: MBL fold metallo-hydrolase [Verrucomicrobia bacterium CG_4_10_14_0_8_um_filter_43_34]PJA44495.1 MAG: MBL fold metallo-hydrolase [Verrucomicrobia bacterium CG_4_9_14_3_um_filter_43_20]
MEIKVFELGEFATNAYLLLDKQLGEAILIDAPEGTTKVIKSHLETSHCTLKHILITHGHWDHTFEMENIRKLGVPSYAHTGDQSLIENPAIMSAVAMRDLGVAPSKIDHTLTDGDEIYLLNQTIRILHVPGHSRGNIAFYFPKLNCVFPGDALFAGSIGRFDLPGGSKEQLFQSIKEKLYTLPDETIVYPGHGPKTTIGHEKKFNNFVRG